MSARDAILSRIQNAVKTQSGTKDISSEANNRVTLDDVCARIKSPGLRCTPALSSDLLAQLVSQMEAVQISVTKIASSKSIVEQVSSYLNAQKIVGEVSVSPCLNDLPWASGVHVGAATGNEAASVTSCFAAVAETGSVVMLSSPESAISLGFLPDTHIVVLKASAIVKYTDDVWPMIRQLSVMPRGVNFITGPSRTADIEQTIELGAHGPRQMHVLLVTDE